MDTDWVSTVHPTRSLAQQAGMASEAYREFVYDAVLRDWESLAEKMGDTVHLALGRAYDANLPAGESGNDSAVHVDLITDLAASARLEVDGETIQQNGVFWFEDGFGDGVSASAARDHE